MSFIKKKVHIVGGGFSGLSLGYYLARVGVPVEIFEKSNRLGGLISTLKFDWGYVETAANGLIGSPLVDELFRDLQLEYAERPAHSTRARYIFRNRPRSWPLSGLENIRFARGLIRTVSGAARATDLTARDWVSQNFGVAAFDYLIGPALQGVMGTDDVAAETLVDYVRGAFANRRQSRQSTNKRHIRRGTVSPRHGMGELISALARRFEELGGIVHLNTSGEWRDNAIMVLAVPAHAASTVLGDRMPELSQKLSSIDYLPITTATVSFGRATDSKGKENVTNGFGCLFPQREKFYSSGVLFASSIFERPGQVGNSYETWLLRGGDDESDESTLKKIGNDRARLTKAGAEPSPKNFKITRWSKALPQYNLKLRATLDDLTKILSRDRGGSPVYLTGNYLGQIGLARILAHNFDLARQIHDEISK